MKKGNDGITVSGVTFEAVNFTGADPRHKCNGCDLDDFAGDIFGCRNLCDLYSGNVIFKRRKGDGEE